MGFKGITVNTAASADAHIFAEDDAAIYQAIFGGDGVMNIGNKFAARVLSNNKVRVSDGVLCVGGHIGWMQYADYTDLTIENGVSGKNRNDIIYAKFVTSGDVDSYVLDVRKGTAGSTAADPAMTQGNLYQGATLREYPLWRVKIEGLSIVKIEQLFSVIPTIPELQEEMKSGLSEVNRKLSGKLEIELLWENPNTGVDFEAQEIELPTLNKYSFYFIIFSGSTYGGGKTEGINTGFIPIDRATELMYIGSYLRWRGVTRSDKGIRIGQGNMVQAYGTSTKENSVCIPAEIYGVK